MKKAIRDAWVQSLRSGLYPQVQGALCRKENGGLGFCCLGVLADVVDPSGWQAPPTEEGDVRPYCDSLGSLPKELREEVQLERATMRRIIVLNDIDRLPFTEIAAWIEENIPVEEAA